LIPTASTTALLSAQLTFSDALPSQQCVAHSDWLNEVQILHTATQVIARARAQAVLIQYSNTGNTCIAKAWPVLCPVL
jgi:hypothetical protein